MDRAILFTTSTDEESFILLNKVESLLEEEIPEIRLESSLDFLINVLNKSNSPVTRHEAAFTIALFNTKYQYKPFKAIEAFNTALKNEKSALVIHEIIEALGFFNYKESLEIINAFINHANTDIRDTARLSKQRIFKENEYRAEQSAKRQ